MKRFLREIKAFSEFTDQEIAEISNFFARKEVQAGEYLSCENAEARSFFVIENGSVELYKRNLNGSLSYVGEVTAGTVIGEESLFNGFRRSFDVVAKGAVNVLELRFDALEKLDIYGSVFEKKLIRALASNLAERLDGTTSSLAEMMMASRLIALGEMAAGIGHEINNVLSLIRLSNDQIAALAKAGPENHPLILEKLSKTESAFARITQIMKGIRLASRNGDNDKPETVVVKKVLENTMQLFQERFDEAGIGVEMIVSPEDLKVSCLPAPISQVIVNLLRNACDAVEKLSEKWIRIEANELPDSYLVSVTDSGRGVSEEIRDKIFLPFYSTKRLENGTGLGLSISKRIIEAHRGRFFLNTKSPNTCFVIQLPKSIEAKSAS